MRAQSPNPTASYMLRHYLSQPKLAISSNCQHSIGDYKYSQSNLLGRGYSSKVYKGYNVHQLNSEYAIKVIQTSKFKQCSIQMLNSEIEIQKSLNHPNIVKCLDVYRTQTHCYIITQYCSGGDLMTVLKHNRRIQEKKVIDIIDQLTQAYKYLITKGILHRDLKPANIFKLENVWKIGDFGFSIKQSVEIIDKVNVGTPLYMPLEALMKNKYSCKSDIFALGIIAYEIYKGKTPWECSTEKELVRKMQNMKIQLPQGIKSEKLKMFIKECCEVSETNRMGKAQFLKFDFNEGQNPEENSIKSAYKDLRIVRELTVKKQQFGQLNIKIKMKESQIQLNNNNSESTDEQNLSKKQTSTISTTPLSTSNLNCTENSIKANTQILLKQLQYCRFIYYLIKNLKYLLTSQQHWNNFKMVLFKLLLKNIKYLQDKKNNIFGLKNWELFKNTDAYNKLNMEFKEYSLRYQRQYLQFLKNVDVNSIKNVNKHFPQLCSSSLPLNCHFYNKFRKYIQTLIRNHNHEVAKLINKSLGSQKSEFGKHFQVSKSLIILHEINLQIFKLKAQDQNHQKLNFVKQKCHMKIQIDYNLSNITVSDYLSIRKKIMEI